jgi:hypothetical protein
MGLGIALNIRADGMHLHLLEAVSTGFFPHQTALSRDALSLLIEQSLEEKSQGRCKL